MVGQRETNHSPATRFGICLVDLDCPSGTDSFAATAFVALVFVGHFAYVVCLVQKQNLFRAEFNTGPTACAQLLVNNHNLVH